MDERSLHVEVHYEGGRYWAEVKEWPGCFAAGETLDELTEALDEAISLYVTPDHEEPKALQLQIREMQLKVEAPRPLIPARKPATRAAPPPARTRDPHAYWPLRGFHRRGNG